MSEGVEGGHPRAAVDCGHGVRAELAARREMEGLGLGHVDESVGVLTVDGIEPRWPGRVDRCGWSVLGEEQSKQKLG